VFGVLPIPGPLHEIALLVVALILVAFYRDLMGEAWASTTGDSDLAALHGDDDFRPGVTLSEIREGFGRLA
jgi:hypothetical protein